MYSYFNPRFIPSPIQRRSRHFVTQHIRSLAATPALRDKRSNNLGALMNDDHISLRDGFDGYMVAYFEIMNLSLWQKQHQTAHCDALWIC